MCNNYIKIYVLGVRNLDKLGTDGLFIIESPKIQNDCQSYPIITATKSVCITLSTISEQSVMSQTWQNQFLLIFLWVFITKYDGKSAMLRLHCLSRSPFYNACSGKLWKAQTRISTPGILHDDVIKWKHFPRYWLFVRGIHRSPVNSPHTGQWRGALMFSLICTWINSWVNNGEAGDSRRHRAHCDVSVMNVCRFIIYTVKPLK